MAKLKDGFYKLTASSIGSDLLVLLAGGGAKPISDFALANGTNATGTWNIDISGNAKSSTLSKYLLTGAGTECDANTLAFSDHLLRWYSSIPSTSSNLPTVTGWLNGLLALPLHSNGVTAQLYFSATKALFYRSMASDNWNQIAYTTSDITGNANTASKLQNKVKIWGLDFDGSSDVKGNILLKSTNGPSLIEVYPYAYEDTYGGLVGHMSTGDNSLVTHGLVFNSSKGTSYNGSNALTLFNARGSNYYSASLHIFDNKVIASTNLSVNGQIISNIADGTAPLVITSTSRVDNLNADAVDGFHMRQWFTNASDITNTAIFWQASGNCSDVSSMGYAALINVIGDTGRRWQIWNSRNNHQLFWRPEKSDMSDWADVHVLLDNYNFKDYVANMYWANVLISSTPNDKTTPTFSNTIINGTLNINSGNTREVLTMDSTNAAGAIVRISQSGTPKMWYGYSPTLKGIYWFNSNDTGIFLSDSDHVGIGLNTPTTKFHVLGTGSFEGTDDTGINLYADAGYTRIRFFNNSRENKATIHYFTNNYSGCSFAKDTLNVLGGSATTIGSWNNPTMYITSNTTTTDTSGKVGIGTTSPSELLHVNGTGRVDNIHLKSTYINLNRNGSDSSIYDSTKTALEIEATTDLSILRTYNVTTQASIVLHKNGNVGIGTLTPTERLLVNGNIKIQGTSNTSSTPDIYLGHYTSWGGRAYPTLMSGYSAKWIMHFNPHVCRHTGTDTPGSNIRMESVNSHYWDISVAHDATDNFRIRYDNSKNLVTISNNGVVSLANSIVFTGSVGSGSGTYLAGTGTDGLFLAANESGKKVFLESTNQDSPWFRNKNGDYAILHTGNASVFHRSDFNFTDDTTVADWTKATSATRYAGNWFSVTGWAWANSGNINVGGNLLDRMRYSALSIRNGNLTSTWAQQAILFIPTYADSGIIYLAQMTTSGTAGSVSTTIKYYGDVGYNDGRYVNVTGDTMTGNLTAPAFYASSDVNLKTNIQEIFNSDKMPIIKEFDWKESGEHSYGLIAQELEEQGYSELVSTKDDGYKTVNYSAALSLIVGKLQVKIKELEKEIEILKNKN